MNKRKNKRKKKSVFKMSEKELVRGLLAEAKQMATRFRLVAVLTNIAEALGVKVVHRRVDR